MSIPQIAQYWILVKVPIDRLKMLESHVTSFHDIFIQASSTNFLTVIMRLPGRIIGLLKEYMHDLVEQARQEEEASRAFGYRPRPYDTDQAISDLLAILDDRIESEGVQVGLHVDFLHQMWTFCDRARAQVAETVWLEQRVTDKEQSKAQTRELTYHALIDYLEHQLDE